MNTNMMNVKLVRGMLTTIEASEKSFCQLDCNLFLFSADAQTAENVLTASMTFHVHVEMISKECSVNVGKRPSEISTVTSHHR